MRLSYVLAVVGFGLAQTILSSPIEERLASSQECFVVDAIVELLKLSRATPFCSSFLAIPPATVVSTATTSSTMVATTTAFTVSTLTVYTSTETDTDTRTTTTATVSTIVSTYVTMTTATFTSDTTSTVTVPRAKRNVEGKRAIQIPPYLSNFASHAISTACSCLSIPQSTHTRTTTVVAAVPATATMSVDDIVSTLTITTTTITVSTDLVVPAITTTTLSESTTTTSITIETVCPNPIQNPGFEDGRPLTYWTITAQAEGGQIDADPFETAAHSGSWCLYSSPKFSNDKIPALQKLTKDKLSTLLPFVSGQMDSAIIFNLSQEVTVCGGQPSVLSFWAFFGWSLATDTCTIQACVGSVCSSINLIKSSVPGTGNNGYTQYSMVGPTFATSTSVLISVSATAGECVVNSLDFDDFALVA